MRILAIIGFLVFIGIGSYQIFKGVVALFTAAESVHWATATVQIVDSKIEQEDPDGGFGTAIKYKYRIGDREFFGTSVFAGDGVFTFRSNVARVAAKYPVGSTHEIHYMPSDPATAFLETGIHPHNFTRIVVGSFFFSSGAILMLLTYLFPKYAMLRADGSYSALPLKHPVSIIAMSGFLFLGFHFYLMYYLR